MNLRFHPAAREEYIGAIQHYQRINPQLAAGFVQEIEHAIAAIQRNPTTWRVVDARGREVPYHLRGQSRVACRFPVTVVHRRTRSVAQAVDYCPGGVQIVGGPVLDVGDAIQLKLQPVGALFGLSLLGQVVWIQRQPEAAYGINLRPTGSLIRRRLQWLYEKLLAHALGARG